MILGSILLVTEIWLVQREHKRAGLALAELERKRDESDRLVRQSVCLNDEDEKAINLDLRDAETVLGDLKTHRRESVDRLNTTSEPESSVDAYIDITAFVEKTRELAERAGIVIRPEERFGFGTYTSEGPAAELIAGVFRQRTVLQYLVEKLIESHPRTVLMIQREPPRILRPGTSQSIRAAAPRADGQSRRGGQPGDIFEIEKRLSLRMAGLLDTEAFRLEFTGQTRSIRSFLNSLIDEDVPVTIVVRSVEIGLPPAPTRSPDSHSMASARTPVPESLTRFVVVVEYVEPVATPAKSVL